MLEEWISSEDWDIFIPFCEIPKYLMLSRTFCHEAVGKASQKGMPFPCTIQNPPAKNL